MFLRYQQFISIKFRVSITKTDKNKVLFLTFVILNDKLINLHGICVYKFVVFKKQFD